MKKIFILILFLLLAFFVFSQVNTSFNPATSFFGPSPTTTANTQEVIVTAQGFSFSPNEITVNQGDRVVVTLNNIEGFHDFIIDEFDVATKQINANQTDTVSFIANKSGTYEFYCSVGDHRSRGMVGRLVVK